ncbi:MAG: hypothetical protein KTR16_11350 [Acidiferrobacterales bacterium]|nr:hypothetical protein [Acidiferrobacterales bacterium]
MTTKLIQELVMLADRHRYVDVTKNENLVFIDIMECENGRCKQTYDDVVNVMNDSAPAQLQAAIDKIKGL